MYRKIGQFALDYWTRIINIGIIPGLPLIECRRIRLLNMLAALAVPLVLVYPLMNFLREYYVLALLNIINVISMLLVFVFHKKHLYMLARYSRIGISLFVYTTAGFWFHTGAEYFLLNTLIITILVFDNKWIIAGISLLILTAVLSVLAFSPSVHFGLPVNPVRGWINIAFSMLFTVLALYFFKSIQQDYQQEIERQKHTLLLMNQDKEKLFSIIAHDIRSPLAGLEVLMDQFQEGILNELELNEASAIIRNRVSVLNVTMDNLLRWSMLGMQGIKTRARHFLLLPVLEEAIQFFSVIAGQKDIQIELQGNSGIAVHADQDQIAVILRNLISNALKFSYSGGKIVVVAEKKENQVLLRIADEGVGMDEQRVRTLFASLQQPGFGTFGERGTGLGLLLCKEFAQLNKGSIYVESQEGKGTVFTLALQKGRMIKESVPVS